MTDVLVEAKLLQSFFKLNWAFWEDNIRESLLECLPVACNYEYNSTTLVTELCAFHSSKHSLAFHLTLKFCEGCEIRLSALYYNNLKKSCNDVKLLPRRRFHLRKRPAEDFSMIQLLTYLKLI